MDRPNNDGKNLAQIANFFIGSYCKACPEKLNKFIRMMKETFTVVEVKPYHTTIASLPWRRIYTTNYDNVIEEAAKVNKIHIDSKDLEDRVDMSSRHCIHINGRIEKLDKESLDKSFKLTSSSYISHETFYNTEWKKRFMDDIEIAGVIIFIGYSLYDMDIEKILFKNNQKIKDRVIFIQQENLDEMDKFDLEQYGEVYSVGTEKFAELIEKYPPTNTEEEIFFECFQELKLIQEVQGSIREADIEKFLIYGKITDDLIQDETIRQHGKPPFLIPRSKISRALEIICSNKTKILVIVGDVGNGKTIFLKQLATKLAATKRVFTLQTRENETTAKQDIDKIANLNQESIIIIDSYTRHTKLLEYIELQQYKNTTIILAARTHEHYRYLGENELLKQASIIEIDTLDDSELEYFYDIIEHGGMWYPSSKGTKTKYSENDKKKIMYEKCKREISLILTEILESEVMKNKIIKILDDIFSKQVNKKQVFAICLLNAMDIPISVGLLEEIIGEHDLSIYRDENLKNIIDINLIDKDNRISVKSPIFSLLILKTYFTDEITQYFLEILELINKKANHDAQLNDIKKNLFRFRFVERLLPEDGKINRLTRYYEKLKQEFDWLIWDPQYWLQYAMCFIMYNDLEKAQQKLSVAYEKATRIGYDVTKINNQQARLNLKKAAQYSTNIKESVELFLEADKLLTEQKDSDTYKYKIMMNYEDFIEKRFNSFSVAQWNQVIGCCKKQLEYLNRHIPKERFKEQLIYEDCKNILEEICTKTK